MSSVDCRLPSEPDVSGVGVRIAVYGQGMFSFVPPALSLLDAEVSHSELASAKTHATTNLILAFTILISCLAQALKGRLSSYHSFIILSLSWMNNTNTFIYFLLYLKHVVQPACSPSNKEPKAPKAQLLKTWRKSLGFTSPFTESFCIARFRVTVNTAGTFRSIRNLAKFGALFALAQLGKK